MKKALYLLIILFSFILETRAAELLPETTKLETTAKLWGFLKYYHPAVAQGKFNWDEQLINLLPQVQRAQDKQALSKVYTDWLASLGTVDVCTTCKEENGEEYFLKNFDLSWTQNPQVFTPAVAEKLKYIQNNRFQGVNYYATSFRGVGNVNITNEPDYDTAEYPNENTRLLSLFKYWNIVEYFFPYKYQTDQNWNDVLTTMIPLFKNARNASEYHLAMLELVAKTNDSHAFLNTPETNIYFGLKWMPAKFKLIDNKAIITGFYNDSLARKDDLRIGDVITQVAGTPIADILTKQTKYITASNKAVLARNAYYAIFNGPTESVKITFDRNGKIANKTVSRYNFQDFKLKPDATSPKWKIIENNIGYVNMGLLETKDVADMMTSLMKCKAIIFDIRNYPKGTMYAISDYLNPEKRDFVKFTTPDLSYPGKFKWTSIKQTGRNNADNYKGQVLILVNETTQSHAEFTAMCLQTADNAMVIGSQTAGADGNVSRFEMVGKYGTQITGLGVFYPDGRETQRIGIVPDIEVKPTIKGIRKGKDEVLEKALAVIAKKKTKS